MHQVDGFHSGHWAAAGSLHAGPGVESSWRGEGGSLEGTTTVISSCHTMHALATPRKVN